MPDKVPKNISEYMPGDLPNRMPEDMPNKILKNILNKIPEDMPIKYQIKCQKVSGIKYENIFYNIYQKICQIKL